MGKRFSAAWTRLTCKRSDITSSISLTLWGDQIRLRLSALHPSFCCIFQQIIFLCRHGWTFNMPNKFIFANFPTVARPSLSAVSPAIDATSRNIRHVRRTGRDIGERHRRVLPDRAAGVGPDRRSMRNVSRRLRCRRPSPSREMGLLRVEAPRV